jgi:DNA-binding NtrC family response regulator
MDITLLLLDDNPDQTTITQRTLGRSGQAYRLETAANAAEGFEKLRTGRYDLILCDYRLPDLNGIDVLKRLKEQGLHLPLVMVTAAGSERLAVEALKLGAADYVVKDATYETVLPQVIERALAWHRDRQERERLAGERDQAVEALTREKAGLKRMNDLMLNREERVLELKKEVNQLLSELGRPTRYS